VRQDVLGRLGAIQRHQQMLVHTGSLEPSVVRLNEVAFV
jgi:hypothetical protein